MIMLAWTQQYIGTSQFILTDTTSAIPPCPNPYIVGVRKFLHQIKGKLVMQPIMVAKKLRVNDQFIMDIAMQQGGSSETKIESINACRRYLQATTLADITNDKGNEVVEEAWNGTRITSQATYRYITFNQKRPNSTAWGHWRSFLRKICDNTRKLRTHLGDWTVQANELRHPPKWVYDPREDQLYQWAHTQEYYNCPRRLQMA